MWGTLAKWGAALLAFFGSVGIFGRSKRKLGEAQVREEVARDVAEQERERADDARRSDLSDRDHDDFLDRL